MDRLSEDAPTLVGIDHGFSFPMRYFATHGLKRDWPTFLDDFQRHWPTDEDIYVDFVRDGAVGNGAARTGNARWQRLTDQRTAGRNRSFISTFKDRWLSRHTLAFRGCALSASD